MQRYTVPSTNIGTIGKSGGCGFWSFIHKILVYHWNKTMASVGKITLWNKCFSLVHFGHNYWQPIIWFFSYNAWRVWRTPDKEIRDHSFIQKLSRSYRFTAPWRCFFYSIHTRFLSASGRGTGKLNFVLSDTFLCWCWCLFRIIVLMKNPTMAYYTISNRRSQV